MCNKFTLVPAQTTPNLFSLHLVVKFGKFYLDLLGK